MTEIKAIDSERGGHLTSRIEAAQMISLIERAAFDKDFDPSKLHALLDFQERLLKRQAEAEFNADYNAMQLELPRVKKDGSVSYPVNKNNPDGPQKEAFKFATWENIDSVIRPLMKRFGFSLSFDSSMREGGGAVVTGRLMHIGGHYITAAIPLSLDTSGGKNNIQAMGSTLSYGKRYVSFMLLNIVTEGEDDDGVRGGLEYITAGQVDRIKRLLSETKTDRNRYLQHIGYADVENIQRADYARCENMLLAKKRQLAGGANDAR